MSRRKNSLWKLVRQGVACSGIVFLDFSAETNEKTGLHPSEVLLHPAQFGATSGVSNFALPVQVLRAFFVFPHGRLAALPSQWFASLPHIVTYCSECRNSFPVFFAEGRVIPPLSA
jgi:hypothetical protein